MHAPGTPVRLVCTLHCLIDFPIRSAILLYTMLTCHYSGRLSIYSPLDSQGCIYAVRYIGTLCDTMWLSLFSAL